jgi:phosphoribosyl-ATP pyrophosphohydrolase/phosphoribosyl-AMP cyclohydrolase
MFFGIFCTLSLSFELFFVFSQIISQKRKTKNRMNIDFQKSGGLVPAIIQDELTAKVLMLGYMNEDALAKTQESGQVTFFSRTKNRLWTKGEESGNFLNVVSITPDCDNDTLLIKVNPVGPVCHTGTDTCWGEKNEVDVTFLKYLQDFIQVRFNEMPEGSYTTSLFKKGLNRMAQKVGEEAVETVIEAINGTEEGFIYEASDLIYHLIVLLTSKGYSLDDLARELKKRHK